MDISRGSAACSAVSLGLTGDIDPNISLAATPPSRVWTFPAALPPAVRWVSDSPGTSIPTSLWRLRRPRVR